MTFKNNMNHYKTHKTSQQQYSKWRPFFFLVATSMSFAMTAASLAFDLGLDESLVYEAESSLARAEAYLLEKQNQTGTWLNDQATTARCRLALALSPTDKAASACERTDHFFSTLVFTPENDTTAANITEAALTLMALSVAARPSKKQIDAYRSQLLRMWQQRIKEEASINEVADLMALHWTLEALYLLTRSFIGDASEATAIIALKQYAVTTIKQLQVIAPHNDNISQPDATDLSSIPALSPPSTLTYLCLKIERYANLNRSMPSYLGINAPHSDAQLRSAVHPLIGQFHHYYLLATWYADLESWDSQRQRSKTWRQAVITALLSTQKGKGNWEKLDSSSQINDISCTAFAIIALRLALA